MPPSPPSRIMLGVGDALEPLIARVSEAAHLLKVDGRENAAEQASRIERSLRDARRDLFDLSAPPRPPTPPKDPPRARPPTSGDAPPRRGFLHVAEVRDDQGPTVHVVLAFGFDFERTWTIAVPRAEFDALVGVHGPLRPQELVELEVSALDIPLKIVGRPERTGES